MKRMAVAVLVVVLLAIAAWLFLPRESRDLRESGAATAAPQHTLPAPQAAPVATPQPGGAPAATSTPVVLPAPDPAQLELAKQFLTQRHELLRQFDAALRFGDPFPFVPVLELMAQHDDSRGARGLYEIQRDCLDPKRKSADDLSAAHVERAARERERGSPRPRSETPELEATRIAAEVAHAHAMDVGCANVTRASADAAWLRLVALARDGNRAARYSVALEAAVRRDELIASGRLVPGSELERAAAAWLLDAALRGRSEQQMVLRTSYCRGGLVAADSVQCYAWEVFGHDRSLFPMRPQSAAYLRGLRDALTPEQQALADKRVAELRACCSRPRY